MARQTVKPIRLITTKRKQGWPANSASKQARNWVFRCLWYLNNLLVILASSKIELAWMKSSFACIKLISHHFKSKIEPFLSKSLFIALVFLLKTFYKVKKFFINVIFLNNYPHCSIFPLFSSVTFWDKRFFFSNNFRFFLLQFLLS